MNRRFDEMQVEAENWLRNLQEIFQELMMGERANYMQNMPEEESFGAEIEAGIGIEEVRNANTETNRTTGL